MRGPELRRGSGFSLGMGLKKIFVAGGVGDGTSTLLGRLLSGRRNDGSAQGIAGGVTWRHVDLDGDRLMIAERPHGVQYVREMVAAASHCDAAVLLVDASRGITAQTLRDASICSLLGIRFLFVAVNKIDLVDYAKCRYEQLVEEVRAALSPRAFESLQFAPTSGLAGCNLSERSPKTPWFSGPALRQWISETVPSKEPGEGKGARSPDEAPASVSDLIEADLVWLSEAELSLGMRYEMRLATASATCTVSRIVSAPSSGTVSSGRVARVELMLERPLALARYRDDRTFGAFVLNDRLAGEAVAVGTITDVAPRRVFWNESTVTRAERAGKLGQRPLAVWFTGLSAAGKSTVSNGVEALLHRKGYSTYRLDGDNIRHGLSKDLGYSEEDRAENIRRVGEVARLMVDAGLIVLASFISPNRQERDAIRDRFGPGEFVEVYVRTPLEVCERRDPKNLYKLARAGKIPMFTGISAPYEEPTSPEIVLDTSAASVEDCVSAVVDYILQSQRGHK